jgi:hypothetical protein
VIVVEGRREARPAGAAFEFLPAQEQWQAAEPAEEIGSVSVRENRHQSGGLLNLLGMTESFSSDFSG